MRYSKRYIVFYIFLAIAFFVKFNTIGKNYEEVDEFRGANLEKTVWNPLIADSVNDNRLSVVIDNKEYSNTDNGFFMDDNLNIMAPVSLLRDALNCSAHIYNDNTLFVEKHTSEISFKIAEDFARVNGTKEKIESPLVQKDGEYYVSLSDLSKYLDYSYSWNIEENTASTADQAETTSVIPASYDLRSKERVSVIKDQGTYGTC